MATNTNICTLLRCNIFLFLTSLILHAAADVPFSSYVVNGGSSNNVTIAVNVPSNTTNDLFFHLSAPAGQQWAAFGFGSQMAGSLMFIAYPADDNSNVTLSPRIATGEVMPQFTQDVGVTLLPGSGISDGTMFVNAQCTGCRSWNGGSLDVKSTAQSMIWAVGPDTTTFTSNDDSAKISQHSTNAMGSFRMDMVKATGDAGVPVVTGNTTLSSSSNSDSEEPHDYSSAIHGLLMIAAFLVVFPGGYLFLRVFEKVWVHMGIQSFGLLLVLGGTISGILLSVNKKISPKLNTPHQIIGLVVMVLVLAAWILGFIGHRMFKKTKTSGIPTKIHRGVGPSAIVLGLINVGVGLRFAGHFGYAIIFYILTLLMIIFIAGILFMLKKRNARRAAMTTPAAQNFNQAYYPGPHATPGYQATGGYYASNTQNVPMQTFGPPQSRDNAHPGSRVYQ